MQYIKITDFDEALRVYWYEVTSSGEVPRMVVDLGYDRFIWDSVSAHVDPASMFGMDSCIEGAFPQKEDWNDPSQLYEEIGEKEFNDVFELAIEHGRGPFDVRSDTGLLS